MSKHFNMLILSLSSVSLVGCGNAIPQVDFLKSINSQQGGKMATSTSNLTPTQELAGTGVKIKGRVSYVGLQQTLSNGPVQIKGKIVQ